MADLYLEDDVVAIDNVDPTKITVPKLFERIADAVQRDSLPTCIIVDGNCELLRVPVKVIIRPKEMHRETAEASIQKMGS